MKPIHQEWISYVTEVLPPTAPKVQITECRRAFFAGAQATLTLIRSQHLDANARMNHDLVDLQEELAEFNQDVQEGRA